MVCEWGPDVKAMGEVTWKSVPESLGKRILESLNWLGESS